MNPSQKEHHHQPSDNTYLCDLYQIVQGGYRHSLKANRYSDLKLAIANHRQLPFSICNQLLKFPSNQSQYQACSKVYHPLIIQQPRFLTTQTRFTKISTESLTKSALTAQSDQSKPHPFLHHIPTYIQNQGLFHPIAKHTPKLTLEQGLLILDERTPHSTPNQAQTLLINKNTQSQDLKQSRLMHLSTGKANKSGIKTTQIPLGYQRQLSKDKLKDPKSNMSEAIQLPQPQQERAQIKHASKLISLFSLRNSESKDDLHNSLYSYHSDSNQESPHIQSVKFTQSKIIKEIKRFYDKQGDEPRTKKIRGLNKKTQQILNWQDEQKVKNLETPKFRNNFSFN